MRIPCEVELTNAWMLKLLKGLPRSLATQQMMAVVSVMFVAVMWVGEAGNPGGGVWNISESFGGPNPEKDGVSETGERKKKKEERQGEGKKEEARIKKGKLFVKHCTCIITRQTCSATVDSKYHPNMCKLPQASLHYRRHHCSPILFSATTRSWYWVSSLSPLTRKEELSSETVSLYPASSHVWFLAR